MMPGPLAALLGIYVGFVHYRLLGATNLVAGLASACVAALCTFIPCYLFTVLAAQYFKRYGQLPAVKAFADGIIAAAVGGDYGIDHRDREMFGHRPADRAHRAATVLVLWRVKNLREPLIVVAAALMGLSLYPLVHLHAR